MDNDILFRNGTIERMEHNEEGQEDARTVELSFSSEEPVKRYDWNKESHYLEVLSHKAEDVDLTFLNSGRAPFLIDHDAERVVGVVESVRLNQDKASATVRLGKSEKASEILTDIRDGIRSNISVGYRLTGEVTDTEEERDGLPVRRFSFNPLEISSVSIPADMSENVGIGRSQELKKPELKPEVKIMEDNIIDVETIAKEQRSENDIRKEVAKTTQEILKLGVSHNQRELAEEAIYRGASLDQFRGELLTKIGNKPLDKSATPEVSPKEQQNYSLVRAVQAAATGNWSKAGFEREINEEMALRAGKDPQGFFAPDFGWGTRDLHAVSGSTYGSGSNIVGQDYRGSSFIDALIAESVLAQLGATVFQGLTGDVTIPAMTTAPTAAFVAEATGAGQNEPVFAQRTLTSRTLTNKIGISRKLMIQADPSIENWLRQTMVRAIATKIDNVAIKGGGSDEPTGVLSTSGIGDVESAGTSGNAALTWANVIDIMTDVQTANAATGSLKWVTHPAVVGKLMQTVRVASTDSVFILNDSKMLLGYDVISTTAAPSSSPYSLVFGNWADLYVGFFGALDVLVDPYTGQGVLTDLIFFQDCDCVVGQAGSFSAAQDVTV